jgi:acyl-coenzyme A synthetase/AMP-(fatty) acid ligase
MMWHWLVSGLASGLSIVLYDGSPFRPLIEGSGGLAMAKLMEEFEYATTPIASKATQLADPYLPV